MAISLTHANFNELLEKNEKLSGQIKRAKEAGEEKAGLLVTGATIVTTEGLLGYLRGRYGEKRMLDVPAEVWAGGACELGALFGLVGKHSEIVAATGHATLAFAAAFEMYKVGLKEAEKDKSKPAQRRQVVDTQGETVPNESRAENRTEELPPGMPKGVVASMGRTMADDVPAEPAVARRERKTGT